MAGSITLAATLAGIFSDESIQAVPDAVSLLEIQTTVSEYISALWLRTRFSGELLYSIPTHHSNGQFAGPLAARHQSLIRAAREYDLVQLDADYDLSSELLAAIPAHQRLICWRAQKSDMARLRSGFGRISAIPARLYSIITQGSSTADAVKPLLLLKELGRADIIAVCEGKSGFWGRLLAPHFGAPIVFGRLDTGRVSDAGEPSIQQIIEDYGFPALHPVREVYGIVGNRVFQSPSPRLHNAGYRALHHPALFLPFYAEHFEDFWRAMVQASALEPLGLSIKGLTIVAPHKETAFATAPLRSPMACLAGASNIFVRNNSSWEAHTTDPESIAGITKNGHKLTGPFAAAVIGCGGAGRAIAAALQQAGARVTLVNRGQERGELAVRLLGLPFVPLSDFEPTRFSLLVNATPVGRDDDCMPFEIGSLTSGTVVVDLVYGTRPAPLVAGVVARGGAVIDGYDVLLNQVRKQFHMMTGREMPSTVSRQTVDPRAFLNFLSSGKQPHTGSALAPVETQSRARIETCREPGRNIAKA